MQTVLNEVSYGAIIELDQGIVCNVPNTSGYNGGYDLPVKAVDPLASSIDDSAHRWIIIRTKQVAQQISRQMVFASLRIGRGNSQFSKRGNT